MTPTRDVRLEEGYSLKVKIPTPCAWRASSSIFGWSMRPPSATKMLQKRALVLSFCEIKTNTIHKGCSLGRGVFTKGEDTHTLCLKSELFDLRVEYANPILRLGKSQRGVREPLTEAKNKGHPHGVSLFFGAGRGIRTPVPFGQTVFKTCFAFGT